MAGYCGKQLEDTTRWHQSKSFRQLGHIQGYGALIALEVGGVNGNFPILVVSDNSERTLGRNPEKLFALQSFVDILDEDQAHDFVDRVKSLKASMANVSTTGPEVLA